MKILRYLMGLKLRCDSIEKGNQEIAYVNIWWYKYKKYKKSHYPIIHIIDVDHLDDDDEWCSLKIMYVFILLKADKGVTFLWLYTLFPIKKRKKESHHWDPYLYLFDLHMWKNERNFVLCIAYDVMRNIMRLKEENDRKSFHKTFDCWKLLMIRYLQIIAKFTKYFDIDCR